MGHFCKGPRQKKDSPLRDLRDARVVTLSCRGQSGGRVLQTPGRAESDRLQGRLGTISGQAAAERSQVGGDCSRETKL